ncbi:MAG: sodium:proton antiporter [Bacteroidetes bacterium GWA2_30_7]|nr:MAG: sodium:proton antiporter [Bacteroidetes bacterium GWA2_30_7]
MELNEKIIQILKEIKHPEIGGDIVSSGIFEKIEIKENLVTIFLKFPRPTDPFKNKIKLICEQSVKNVVPENFSVIIDLNEKKKIEPQKNNIEQIKNFIVIASGKGGVGKSTISSNLAVSLAKKGYKTGLIDADVFGPSIPKMFGLENEKPIVETINGKHTIIPFEKYGVKLNSIGFFVNPKDATIWRGPMASNALTQLIMDTKWGELDFLLFDLPPGTSDIHLSLVQNMAITGAVIVSTPQQVALADTIKGINMFREAKINVPILGLVENMSWFTTSEMPDKKFYIFGREGCKNLAEKENIPLLGQIPIVESICKSGDDGMPVCLTDDKLLNNSYNELCDNFISQLTFRNENVEPSKKVEIHK